MPISFQSTSGEAASAVVIRIRAGLKPNVADMQYCASRQRDRMIRRTGQGIDSSGQAFAAYKPAYAKRKAKTGRDSGIVDLTWSGRMLKAMQTARVTASSFAIGIYGDEGVRAAVHNYGLGTAPERHFMGASVSERRAMAKDIEARIMARMNGTALNSA